jgi:uncharacterized protein (TIGR01244 family)
MTNFKKIGDGLFIGPQPTEQDLRDAKQHGIQTVIDMRMPEETATRNADLVGNSGLHYVNVPVNKTALSEAQINELEQVMQRTPGPHLLHCATGTRAALMLALGRAKHAGWTAERTFDEAQSMGFDLRSSADFASFVRRVTAK